MTQDTKKPSTTVFHGWWIIIAGATINFLSAGMFFYGFSNYMKPLVNEFGWSRASVSMGTSFSQLEGALEAPVVGYLIDKLGPRRLMLFGISLLGIGYILLSRVHSFGMYLAVFLGCMGIGQSFGMYMPIHTTAANWFVKKRSLVMGILQTGTGAGGALTPLFAWIITQYGWRTGAVTSGIILLVVAVPLTLVFRHKPEQYGCLPDGELVGVPKEPISKPGNVLLEKRDLREADFTPKETLKTKAFWALAVAFGMAQAVSSSLVLHSVPHLTDVGIPAVMAATAVGAIGVVSIVGRVAFGWFGDRGNKRHLLAICYALEIVGILIFANIHSSWLIIPFLLVYCIGYGGVQPMMLSMIGDFFGRKYYGSIFGNLQFFKAFIQVPLPILTGWIFDFTKSYFIAFMLFIVLLVIALGLMLIVKPPTKTSLRQPDEKMLVH